MEQPYYSTLSGRHIIRDSAIWWTRGDRYKTCIEVQKYFWEWRREVRLATAQILFVNACLAIEAYGEAERPRHRGIRLGIVTPIFLQMCKPRDWLEGKSNTLGILVHSVCSE